MVERFFPNLVINSVYDIDSEILINNKIKGIILDIDNTLIKDREKEADEKTIAWVDMLKKKGFKISLVSNGRKKRVEMFNRKLMVHAVHEAVKPMAKGFFEAVNAMGISPEETAVVGDQIFTDIYGGNRLNMFTILVKPLGFREMPLIKIKRIGEMYVLWRYGNASNADFDKRNRWKKEILLKRTGDIQERKLQRKVWK